MRRSFVSACILLLSSLGCSADQDAAAATKAAQSAAGGVSAPIKVEPLVPGQGGKDGGVVEPGGELEGKLPGGKPGGYKPNPSEATATCITDDDDGDPPSSSGEGQGKPPVTSGPKPIDPIDPKAPTKQGAQPNAAGAKVAGGAGSGGETAVASTARSSTAAGTTVTAEKLDYSGICRTKMSDSCRSFCSDKGYTWDSTAGNGGTCFSLARAATVDGLTTYECGCMCKA